MTVQQSGKTHVAEIVNCAKINHIIELSPREPGNSELHCIRSLEKKAPSREEPRIKNKELLKKFELWLNEALLHVHTKCMSDMKGKLAMQN